MFGKIPAALQMFRLTQAVSLICGGKRALGPSTGAPGGSVGMTEAPFSQQLGVC